MHVANFKARSLTRQTTRTKCRNTALMGNFRKRIRLIHELRKLARAKEFANSSRNRLAVDQILRGKTVAFRLIETFLDRTFDAHQTCAELIFREFTYATNTTIAEVVNIIDAVYNTGANFAFFIDEINVVLAISQCNEHRHSVYDVFLRQRALLLPKDGRNER